MNDYELAIKYSYYKNLFLFFKWSIVNINREKQRLRKVIMIKRIDTKSGKIISYVYNLKDEDYKILSERLEIDEEKIKNVIDEEIFTPRISKSDWEIYKLYYPAVKKSTKDKEFTSYEINPIVIFLKKIKLLF
ncbi:hypothetical protein GCWU000323_00284 [Leptotrichia hofstadii F0254]|uniref:Uncharacterized protein n=2 Tax=Leptotrichia hofstadii TaxID=157688 RepID=C9MUR5_9FUSO|nr:hypothetical protein GCWU000323_00284 [Leptotrichia hofstadii F0254]